MHCGSRAYSSCKQLIQTSRFLYKSLLVLCWRGLLKQSSTLTSFTTLTRFQAILSHRGSIKYHIPTAWSTHTLANISPKTLERDMLLFCYLKKLLPVFVDGLYSQRRLSTRVNRSVDTRSVGHCCRWFNRIIARLSVNEDFWGHQVRGAYHS